MSNTPQVKPSRLSIVALTTGAFVVAVAAGAVGPDPQTVIWVLGMVFAGVLAWWAGDLVAARMEAVRRHEESVGGEDL